MASESIEISQPRAHAGHIRGGRRTSRHTHAGENGMTCTLGFEALMVITWTEGKWYDTAEI